MQRTSKNKNKDKDKDNGSNINYENDTGDLHQRH